MKLCDTYGFVLGDKCPLSFWVLCGDSGWASTRMALLRLNCLTEKVEPMTPRVSYMDIMLQKYSEGIE